MADKTEDSNDALGRIAPKRKSLDKPVNPYVPKQPSINEGVSLPKPEPALKPMPSKPVTRPRYTPFPVVKGEEKPEPIKPVAPPEPEPIKSEYQGDELDDIIRDVKSGRPKKLTKILFISLTFILLCAAGGAVYYFFLREKPSVYTPLTSENYNQNSVSFSFKYPSVLNETEQLSVKNPDVLAAFDSTIGADNALVDLSTLSDSQIISSLKLTPSDILNQIKNGKGSYISYLDKNYPSNYKNLFGTCYRNMVNSANQVMVVCSDNTNGYINTRLVGADNNYQYILQLYMSRPVWDNNQNTWKKVESSFNW